MEHIIFNPFHATGLCRHPLKTENQRFSYIFRGYRKRPLAWNVLKVSQIRSVLANKLCWIFSSLPHELSIVAPKIKVFKQTFQLNLAKQNTPLKNNCHEVWNEWSSCGNAFWFLVFFFILKFTTRKNQSIEFRHRSFKDCCLSALGLCEA